MNIVLICEKPSFAKAVIDELLFVESEMDHSSFTIGWASEFYHLNSAFSFRRGDTYSSFPMTLEASYKPMSFQGCYLDGDRRLAARKGLSRQQRNEYSATFDAMIDDEAFVETVKKADVVYIAIDPGPSGYHVQLRVRQWLAAVGGSFLVKHLVTYDLGSVSIHNGLRDAGEIVDLEELAKLSILRRHFDYNYLLNARPVMGMTFEKAFAKRFDWPLSKHELQLLYFMRDGELRNDGNVIETMSRWKGTGRYETKGWSNYHGMGNPASRATIIQNLLAQGFLERPKGKALAISAQGERLLAFMHPDCEDPDQVIRLYDWAQLSIADAKGKIDRYINTFFGKQKRFLSKVS